jgi:hypothetical protein
VRVLNLSAEITDGAFRGNPRTEDGTPWIQRPQLNHPFLSYALISQLNAHQILLEMLNCGQSAVSPQIDLRLLLRISPRKAWSDVGSRSLNTMRMIYSQHARLLYSEAAEPVQGIDLGSLRYSESLFSPRGTTYCDSDEYSPGKEWFRWFKWYSLRCLAARRP